MAGFNPNNLTFEEGLDRIRKTTGGRYLGGKEIVTSRDDNMASVTRELRTRNVPDGFTKWQLPVALDGPSQFFMSYAAPEITVPPHSHDEGDGLRIIVSGSIIYDGKELGPGDWMYIPRGTRYDFKVGEKGAGMAYCYQCCCA